MKLLKMLLNLFVRGKYLSANLRNMLVIQVFTIKEKDVCELEHFPVVFSLGSVRVW